jgi:hypothetical protein
VQGFVGSRISQFQFHVWNTRRVSNRTLAATSIPTLAAKGAARMGHPRSGVHAGNRAYALGNGPCWK